MASSTARPPPDVDEPEPDRLVSGVISRVFGSVTGGVFHARPPPDVDEPEPDRLVSGVISRVFGSVTGGVFHARPPPDVDEPDEPDRLVSGVISRVFGSVTGGVLNARPPPEADGSGLPKSMGSRRVLPGDWPRNTVLGGSLAKGTRGDPSGSSVAPEDPRVNARLGR